MKSWTESVLHTAIGFGKTDLPVLEGHLPIDLAGTLYRNGPARLERGDDRVGHWFDGDGAVLAVKFSGGQAQATYRYVESAGYQAEAAADKFLYGGYGTQAQHWWERWRSVKNVANTSVLAYDDRLLALWEGGLPHALDPDTLETHGLDNLGQLSPSATYSAHPKRDPHTGEVFNFGISYGKETILNLYRSTPSGQIRATGQVTLPGIPMLHDFVLAGRYLIFCIPPAHLNLLPVMLRLQTFSDSMQWKPQLGTEILICDRDSLAVVSRFQVDPWFQWHFGNGAEQPDGTVTIDLVRYADFATNRFLQEVASGSTQTIAPARLWRLHLDPQAGKLLEATQLSDRQCEFPTVAPQLVGQPWRYTYLNTHRPGTDETYGELFQAIGRLDHHTGELLIANCGSHCYPSEPLYAPDRQDDRKGWILCVVFNSEAHRSEVWIYDADRLMDPPIARLALPEVIPLGFHGTWHPR